MKLMVVPNIILSELSAYSEFMNALRASGGPNPEKDELIATLRKYWDISIERHSGEIRRVVADGRLSTIADT